MLQLIKDIVLSKDFFPSVIIVLNVLSCARYILSDNIGKAVYWGAAAVLTASVTYWME